MLIHQHPHPFARAFTEAGDNDSPPHTPERVGVFAGGGKQVEVFFGALLRKIATRPAADLDSQRLHRLSSVGSEYSAGAGRKPLIPFLGGQIEPVRGQRIVGRLRSRPAANFARCVLFLNHFKSRGYRLSCEAVHRHHRFWNQIEDRFQVLVKQR